MWNLSGQVLPIATAILVIPTLIAVLGNARFAALTLVWTLLGYFSLFDLGISRSLTYRVAQLAASDDFDAAGRAARSGLACLVMFGLILAAALAAIAPAAATLLMSARPTDVNLAEAIIALRLVACGVPVVMLAAGLRGILEGRSAFGPLNAVLIPSGILTFALPAIALGFDRTLIGVTAAVLIARVFAVLGLVIAVAHNDRRIRIIGRLDSTELRRLLGFGLWFSISAIIGPLMVYGDRFALVALIPLDQLAYYTTPFDIITRAAFVPGAIMAVFFPLIVQSRAEGPEAFARRYRQALAVIAATMICIAVVLGLFALYGLTLWLGAEFARQSELVAVIIAIGITINGLAIVPLATIQAAGHPAFTAKLYLFELPIYFVMLILCAREYGIVGAASAWTCRVVVDTAILFVAAAKAQRWTWPAETRGADLAQATNRPTTWIDI